MDSFYNKNKNSNEEFERFSKSLTSFQALAIFGAIIYHVDPLFILHMTIGADLFAFLSGLLLTVVLLRKNEKNYSWKQWYKKRIIRIYPILVLSTLFILAYRFITARRVFEVNTILINMSGFQSLPGSPDYLTIDGPHWFITLILTCYFLFPLFFFLIKKNFKLILFLGFFLYALYVPFAYIISDALEEFIYIIFEKEVILISFEGYFPRYFVFLFGMLLGFWIEQDEKKNLNFFQNKKNGLLSFISLVFLIILYLIYLYIVFTFENENTFSYYFNFRVFFQPLITISLVSFLIFFFYNKPRINKILKLPGKEAYEIIMIHTVGMLIILYILPNYLSFLNYILLIVICILMIFIFSIFMAYPLYYIGKWVKNENKFHFIIIIFSISFILYAIIAYSILFFNLFELNNINSIILYSSIFIILSLIISIRVLIITLQH